MYILSCGSKILVLKKCESVCEYVKWQNKKKYNKKTYTHARTYTRIAKVVNSSSLLLLWCLCQHTRRHTPTYLHIVQVVCGAVYVCDCAPLIAKESESEREGEREQSLSLVFIFFSPRVFIYLFFSNNFRIVKSFFFRSTQIWKTVRSCACASRALAAAAAEQQRKQQ